MRAVQIGVLGSLEVRDDDGSPVFVAGARLRALLIILALTPGRLVPTAQLVDGIWADDPPAGAANALQALVSRLRRALPSLTIESHPAGYRVLIDPDAVDVARFERLVAAGRATSASDPAAAVAVFGEALALWRGPALLDVADAEFFQAPRTRLDELRLTATEERAEAALRSGHGGELATELTALVADHPLRERLVAVLMRALAAADRPAEALTVYERTREALADQLGTDPSPRLSDLHTAILRGEVAGPPPMDRSAGSEPGTVELPSGDRPMLTNLRAGLTSFVGRDTDVERVRNLLDEYRLVTLTGPGGSGKTRLAGEASHTLVDRMPDGVWLVELAPVGDGAGIPSAVLAAMGLREQALATLDTRDDPADRLVGALRSRAALLVLDNCEHVIDAAAALTDRLLGECPQLRILATSREPLGITGEAVWPVEPLALPPAGVGTDIDQTGTPSGPASGTGADAPTSTNAAHIDGDKHDDTRSSLAPADSVLEDRVLAYDAVRLLVDRARAARPGFTVTAADASALVRICRALDGMPLAIELAAARLRTMTPEQLAARLDDRFRLLTGGSRTALPRHQTLRAVVDWGWELLSEPERVLLRRLAVFTGGAAQAAVERTCTDDAVHTVGAGGGDVAGGVGEREVADLLGSLADKSLLVVDNDGEVPWFRLLETIKAYGLERLAEAGELDAVRRAHIGWLIDLAVTAEPHLHRAEQLEWLRRLRAVHDDIAAAVRGASAAGDADNAVRLVAACGWYWWLSGHKSEGIELTIQALAVPGPTDLEARATACAVVTFLITSGVGDLRQAAHWVRQARELGAGVENPGPFLRFMPPLNVILSPEDEPLLSLADALAPMLEDPDPWFRAQARLTRAQMLPAKDREADVTQALAEFRSVGERWGISYALTTLADLYAKRGELARAIKNYEQAIVAISEIGTVDDIVMMRSRLAQLRWQAGDRAGSAAEIARVEREAEQVAWPDGLAIMALSLAALAAWAGDLVTSRQQLIRAQSLLRDIPVHPVFRAIMLETQARLDAAEGRWDAVAAARAEAFAAVMNSDDADEESVGHVLVGVAEHALHRDRPADAVRLLAAVEVLAGGLDRSSPEAMHTEEAARAALGDGAASELLATTVREFAALDADAVSSLVRELAASVLGG